MGKAAFVHLSDGVTRLQIYVEGADVKGSQQSTACIGGEVEGWELFDLLDHGDFIGVEGYLFITKTGELSIHVQHTAVSRESAAAAARQDARHKRSGDSAAPALRRFDRRQFETRPRGR